MSNRADASTSADQPFLTDVNTLREPARYEIQKGPVTSAYGADVARVATVLNEALATELVCVLRYQQHHYTATGLNAEPIAAESIASLHASPSSAASPTSTPRRWRRGPTPSTTANNLLEMVKEDLVAERVAIASYTEIISWLGDKDPTTRGLIESVLEVGKSAPTSCSASSSRGARLLCEQSGNLTPV